MKIILYILFIVSVLSCSSVAEKEEATVSIDLDNISTRMEIIPLETNDSSLISSVSKIVHRNNRYYILDKEMDRIVAFDDQGKFLNLINKKGNGPGEYTGLSDFCQ